MAAGSPPGPRAKTEAGARLLLATKWLDRAQLLFDRVRSEIVASLASDEVLDRFNDLVYSRAEGYDPSSPGFRSYLFPWEEQVIDRYFPAPPARVLVGGGGSGRETFALLERGYEVTMFDPSEGLLRLMSNGLRPGSPVEVYLGAYETLPMLRGVDPQAGVRDLQELERFDAAMLGWGSFSHVRTTGRRIHALRSFGHVTDGPIVVSFLQMGSRDRRLPRSLARLRDHLRVRRGRTRGDAFSIYIGFYHVFSEAEFRTLADEAGLEVAHLSEERESWPHGVLLRR